MIDMEQLIADRAAGTEGLFVVEFDDQSGIGRTHAVYVCSQAGWPEGQLARVNVQDGLGEREANARRFARVADLEAAFIEAVAVLEGIASCQSHAKGDVVDLASAFLARYNIKGGK